MIKKTAALPACASRILSRAVFTACLCTVALAALPARAGSVSYSYDTLGRLASAVYSDGSAITTITYSYDAAGNRSSVAATSS